MNKFKAEDAKAIRKCQRKWILLSCAKKEKYVEDWKILYDANFDLMHDSSLSLLYSRM